MENRTDLNGLKVFALMNAIKKALQDQEVRQKQVNKKMYDKLLSEARHTIITGKN